MYRAVLILFFVSRCSSAVIYSLNESEYHKMPALFHLDPFESCLAAPGGTYCVLDMELFSNTDSDLMTMIQGYSADTVKHYNHTQIHRGVCVTSTCKQFIGNHSTNIELDLNRTLEACLNDTLWNSYKIQGRLVNLNYCKKENERNNIDTCDIVVAVIYVTIIMLNVVGSLYDVMIVKENKSGNPYLLAFSLRRNWARLVAPIDTEKEPRLERLRLFYGLRTMTLIGIIWAHVGLCVTTSYLDNPLFIEKTYEDPLQQILYSGGLVTHTFFMMSAFLVAYNLCLYAEKHTVSWVQWPKGILQRWLRLTPTYALILATICTWMRHAGSGPLWDLVVSSESTACRQYWWAHVLYINNYVYDDALCAEFSWYLAADTQLFCLGLLVCLICRKPRARVAALVALFVIALVTVAAHTYFQDLDALVIQSPESFRKIFIDDDTYRLVYIRAHTNLSSYTLGLATGFLTYYWQTQKKDLKTFRKHRWTYWVLFPLGAAVIFSGFMFYRDGGPPSGTAFRVLYATFYKTAFQLTVVGLILGCVFKVETLYRGIMEWRGFTWTGRVNYSAYLVHTLIIRVLVGASTSPLHFTVYNSLMMNSATIYVTYTSAAALWLLVEAPGAGIIRTVLGERKQEAKAAEGNDDGCATVFVIYISAAALWLLVEVPGAGIIRTGWVGGRKRAKGNGERCGEGNRMQIK